MRTTQLPFKVVRELTKFEMLCGSDRNSQVRTSQVSWEGVLLKSAATGVCECTGLLGPALGGGHGFTQGLYGLAVDNIISARVLLGNGTLVSVSENEHHDLWWGLRGAGANFGIVTEIDFKVYDVPKGKDSWYHETWEFDQTVLEKVFDEHNVFLDNMPAGAVLYSAFMWNPALDNSSASLQSIFCVGNYADHALGCHQSWGNVQWTKVRGRSSV